MKKWIFLSLLVLIPTRIWSQQDSLTINFKNGKHVTIALSQIRKITFDSLTASVSERPIGAHSLEVSAIYPNPLNRGTIISFNMATGGNVHIAIHTIKGDLIKTLFLSNCEAGINKIEWNGLDDHAISVPSGEYLCEIRFKNEVLIKKMEIVR